MEIRSFLKGWSVTVGIFAIAIVIQFGFLINDFNPLFIVLPIVVSNIFGILIGWNNVLRLRLKKAIADRSRMFSSISHEFRTPLNAITGFAQLILADPRVNTDENLRDYVHEILHAGEHFLILVNDILDLSRLEAGKLSINKTMVRLPDIIDVVVSILEPLSNDKEIKIVKNFSNVEEVYADEVRLKQVLVNLVSNAIKYNVQRGKITISCSYSAENRVLIEVEDNGIGIPATHHDKIFQLFERTNDMPGTVEGTGVGLSLSRDLVRVMGGTIGLKSQPDVGSTFWIELPATN